MLVSRLARRIHSRSRTAAAAQRTLVWVPHAYRGAPHHKTASSSRSGDPVDNHHNTSRTRDRRTEPTSSTSVERKLRDLHAQYCVQEEQLPNNSTTTRDDFVTHAMVSLAPLSPESTSRRTTTTLLPDLIQLACLAAEESKSVRYYDLVEAYWNHWQLVSEYRQALTTTSSSNSSNSSGDNGSWWSSLFRPATAVDDKSLEDDEDEDDDRDDDYETRRLDTLRHILTSLEHFARKQGSAQVRKDVVARMQRLDQGQTLFLLPALRLLRFASLDLAREAYALYSGPTGSRQQGLLDVLKAYLSVVRSHSADHRVQAMEEALEIWDQQQQQQNVDETETMRCTAVLMIVRTLWGLWGLWVLWVLC